MFLQGMRDASIPVAQWAPLFFSGFWKALSICAAKQGGVKEENIEFQAEERVHSGLCFNLKVSGQMITRLWSLLWVSILSLNTW